MNQYFEYDYQNSFHNNGGFQQNYGCFQVSKFLQNNYEDNRKSECREFHNPYFRVGHRYRFFVGPISVFYRYRVSVGIGSRFLEKYPIHA